MRPATWIERSSTCRSKAQQPEHCADQAKNEGRSPLVVGAEAEMSDHRREIYPSENGDRWLLCRDDDGRVFVLHKANLSSGGTATEIELGDFLERGKAGPEHQALARLIGSLVDGD